MSGTALLLLDPQTVCTHQYFDRMTKRKKEKETDLQTSEALCLSWEMVQSREAVLNGGFCNVNICQ